MIVTREELNKSRQKAVSYELRRKKQKKIFMIIFKFIVIFSILAIIFYSYNKYISTKMVIVREDRIVSSKIPSSFDGVKVVQFSDLHYGSTIFIDDVKRLVKMINERKPDIVVFTGDLINKGYDLKSDEQELLITELTKIEAGISKYAITGEEDKEEFLTIFNQSGFSILNNDYDLVYNNSNEPILIVGVSSKLSLASDIDKAYSYYNSEVYNNNIYTISLIHEPDLVNDIKDKYSTDLFLAGHSHNNSINIPFLKSPYKIDGALTYNEEYYEIDNSKLYVSGGIGTNGYGIRLFCHPSFNFFRLATEE